MKKIKSILKKNALLLSLVLVIGIIVAGYYVNKKMRVDIKAIEEEIKTKHAQVTKYEKEESEAPSPRLIEALKMEKVQMERKFDFLMNNFSTATPIVPEFTMYPSVEFKEFLYFSQDRLYKRADKRKVQLPASLGFPTSGLSPQEQIPTLTLQFEVVKDLIGLVIDSGVTTVESITPGVPQQVAFYQVLPIQLGVAGTSNEIMRFLKYIENPSSYFLLKNFSVRKEGGLFRAAMGINAVIIKRTGTES